MISETDHFRERIAIVMGGFDAADFANSGGGANWYYYEDNPLINPPGGVVADGKGDTGNAKTICVGCHMAAGADMLHPGHDFVYTQVP